MTVGEKIKELRMVRGWNAETLAGKCGVSPATIYRYENGSTKDPSTSALRKIADALGIDVSALIGSSDGAPAPDPAYASVLWAHREELRRDPKRRRLYDLAERGTDKDVAAAVALLDALRAIDPAFCNGDDPA